MAIVDVPLQSVVCVVCACAVLTDKVRFTRMKLLLVVKEIASKDELLVARITLEEFAGGWQSNTMSEIAMIWQVIRFAAAETTHLAVVHSD